MFPNPLPIERIEVFPVRHIGHEHPKLDQVLPRYADLLKAQVDVMKHLPRLFLKGIADDDPNGVADRQLPGNESEISENIDMGIMPSGRRQLPGIYASDHFATPIHTIPP
jgi:hypothetical protein